MKTKQHNDMTCGIAGSCSAALANRPISIGSRLELFVDAYLIDTVHGVYRKLNLPEPKGPVMFFDRPWEGAGTNNITVFDDGIPGGMPSYRMYYTGLPMQGTYKEYPNVYGPTVVCLAESRDGVHWTRPNLNIFTSEYIDGHGRKFTPSAPNNIVWIGQGKYVRTSDNFVPFKDANPDCKPEARYKAIGRYLHLPDTAPPEPDETGYPWAPGAGLMAMQSPDGIHWSLMQQERIIKKTETDAQNVAFWDSLCSEYRCYTRVKRKDGTFLRSIATLSSKDFIHWSDPPTWLDYGDTPEEHLYNDCILPYYRAPHIYLGMIMRLVPGRCWVQNHPESEITDAIFMSSRDGIHFDRSFMEGWIRPGLDPYRESWVHGNTAPAWGLLATAPGELSVYWIDHSQQLGSLPQLQRGTLRTDGFVSVHAKYDGGEFTTKLLNFTGSELVINFATSAVGSVRVEIQDTSGKPIPGFAVDDCPEIYGDFIDHIVAWKHGKDLSRLADQPVRLRFVMKDADLYSIQFRQ